MFLKLMKWPAVVLAFAAMVLALAQPAWSQDGTFKVVMEITGLT